MATLTGKPASLAVNTPSGTITLDRASLISEMSITDAYWSVQTNWAGVSFIYNDATTSEKHALTFTASNTSIFEVSATARQNQWYVSQISIVDHDNGYYIIPRSSFPTANEFDILINSGIVTFWHNLTNMVASGSQLTKNAGGDAFNSGATSVQTIVSGDGHADFVIAQTNKNIVAGLSTSDNVTTYTVINFGIAFEASDQFQVYESGILAHDTNITYTTSDVFTVAIESGVVKYKKNGTVFYTSLVSPSYPLHAAASILDQGSQITSASIA